MNREVKQQLLMAAMVIKKLFLGVMVRILVYL
nr:MAG TPA: hypothetical protein [Caudoviricetes sp.]